jgi:uncharacterized protein DUF2877
MMPFAMRAWILAPTTVWDWEGAAPLLVQSPPPHSMAVGASIVTTLRVTRLGSHTRERAHRAPSLGGRVHSVFERAINVLWFDGRLLTLQGPGVLVAPFAVALSRLPERGTVAPGMPLSGTAFDWTAAKSVDLHMPRGPLDFPLDALGQAARAATQSISPAARALELGLASLDGGAVAAAAGALIGLGEGLTPAGDDCVVGALAVLHRLRPDWLAANSRVTDTLAAAARTRTTDIARDFVLEALAGRFAEPVLAVVTAECVAGARLAAERLARFGATSGADTLHGIRLAGRALERSSVA